MLELSTGMLLVAAQTLMRLVSAASAFILSCLFPTLFFTCFFPYFLYFYLSLVYIYVFFFPPLTEWLCRMLTQYYLSLQWGFTSDFILNRIKSRPKLCDTPKWKIMREGSEAWHLALLKTFLGLWWLRQTLSSFRDEHLQHFYSFYQYFSTLLVPSGSEGRILNPNHLCHEFWVFF